MQIITIAEFMHWAFSNFRVQISCKFVYQGFLRIATAAYFPLFSYVNLFQFISVLDGRFWSFNSLKEILILIKILIPPPLEFLPNLNGFAKPETRNCSKRNISPIFVSGYKRKSILFVMKEVSISNLFLIELIFNCPILIRFEFSSLRFCKVSVALLPLLFFACFLKREGWPLRLVYVTVI